MFGGFVAWEKGSQPDGSDSLAVEVAPREHWPDLHAVICVVSDAKKGTASTAGMQRTVETSPLLQERIRAVVPDRMRALEAAIKARDFNGLAEIAMRDSNNFHACCLDTDPPIFYLNDVSRAIIALVIERNRISQEAGKGYFAAYTFDAGPNAVIFTPAQNAREVVDLVSRFFPQTTPFVDPFALFGGDDKPGHLPLPEGFNSAIIPVFPAGSVSRLIHTAVGDGPRVLDSDQSLIGSDGLPKSAA
jgi:diphosphomevalonate decarboxylase